MQILKAFTLKASTSQFQAWSNAKGRTASTCSAAGNVSLICQLIFVLHPTHNPDILLKSQAVTSPVSSIQSRPTITCQRIEVVVCKQDAALSFVPVSLSQLLVIV